MMSIKKCPPPTPLCISCRTIKISSSCKHWRKIWSCPWLYNFLLMMVKGNAFNTNFFHYSMEYPSRKFSIEMYVCTSYSHSYWSKNNDASVVLSSTPGFSVALRSCERAYAIKWKCLGLYTIKKSYFRNNNSHFAICPNSWGFLTRYSNAMWLT